MIEVERTDFVSVPVADMARAKTFYGETLGLPLVSGGDAWPEYRLGENVSLYLVDPTNIGGSFTAPHSSSIALRVADVAAARAALEAKGVAFDARSVVARASACSGDIQVPAEVDAPDAAGSYL